MPLVLGQHVPAPSLTGRLGADPSALVREEILDPQFHHEVTHLLPDYVEIEKVLVVEYLRMALIDADQARALGTALASADRAAITGRRDTSLSDVAFAIERHVEDRLPSPVPRWHVDRSRNDLQACAQLMFGRAQLVAVAGALLELAGTAGEVAAGATEDPMPGYTHFQAAQIITPGFYFATLAEQLLHAGHRLLATYDGMDACPLGAGALAGQELDWDRDRMAGLLGFARPHPMALSAVASRAWAAEVTAEIGLLAVPLSRFCTDLLAWAGSDLGFVELPDELAGVSSAMPQKKNHPILERIRGRTAHLTAFHVDTVLGQRNTPYTNLVEVSKESTTHLLTAFTACHSVLRLLTVVLSRLRLRTDRMAAACAGEYFGGFTLANALTMDEDVPWRRAQVIAGAYVVAAMDTGAPPADVRPDLLTEIAAGHGHHLTDPARALTGAFDVHQAIWRKKTAGSTHPEAVRAALTAQRTQLRELADAWAARQATTDNARSTTNRALGLRQEGGDPAYGQPGTAR
ncbi:lyase family protein [Actinophytocola sediminis]